MSTINYNVLSFTPALQLDRSPLTQEHSFGNPPLLLINSPTKANSASPPLPSVESELQSRRPSALSQLPPELVKKKEVDVFKVKEKKKNRMEKILDHHVFQIVVTLLTVFTLFGADAKVLINDATEDYIWDIFFFLSLSLFTFEIVIGIIGKKDYPWSFFFWLDIFSTLTILLDISLIDQNVFSGSNPSKLARASRAARIGTKAGRMVRILRLVKIWKNILYKLKEAKPKINFQRLSAYFPANLSSTSSLPPPPSIKNQLSMNDTKIHPKNGIVNMNSRQNGEMEEEDQDLKESRVGKKLSELTTKRVVVLVMILIFIVPLFSADYFFDKDKAHIIIIQQIAAFPSSLSNQNNQTIKVAFEDLESHDYPLVYLNVPSLPFHFESDKLEKLRFEEKEAFSVEKEGLSATFDAIIDISLKARLNAAMGIIRTVFVSLLLTLGAFFFHKDANELALAPIERMIQKINIIASNPLSKDLHLIANDSKSLETTSIENAIIKIGRLLALGFGEAGSEIIAANMAKGGDVKPMSAGKKVFAVFGFCDIRNFTDATEVLQEGVMIFVNSIASVVHGTVDKMQGAANKNIGDAFLLVWRIPSKLENKKNRLTKNNADFALIAFLKIIASINRKPALLEYRKNKALLHRIPGYKIKMGFGLHYGWAIEGAIGSEFKIDASYLSPNVNLASRLEAATKYYGVFLLISHALHERFSKRMQRVCREIDKVTVKGSKLPLGLFTVDLGIEDLPLVKAGEASQVVNSQSKKEERHGFAKREIERNFMDAGKNEAEVYRAADFLDIDWKLKAIVKRGESPFKQEFKQGFSLYLQGSWERSREYLERAKKINGGDGPSECILSYMKGFNWIAPRDWNGVRELTEK